MLRNGRERHFLHDLIDGLPFLHSRGDHAAQPALMRRQDCGPIHDQRAGCRTGSRCISPASGRGYRLWRVHGLPV